MSWNAALRNVSDFARSHPYAATAIGTGVAVVAAPGLIAAPVLAIAGFSSQGIAAGSLAAGAQSAIGSVVAPSLFATLQSAGAGGYGVAAVYGFLQTLGTGAVVAGGVAATRKCSCKEVDGDEEERGEEGDGGQKKCKCNDGHSQKDGDGENKTI